MSPVTRLVLLAVFAAMGWGGGELVAGNWGGRIVGALGGLLAGLAVMSAIQDKLGSLEDEGPRERDEPRGDS